MCQELVSIPCRGDFKSNSDLGKSFRKANTRNLSRINIATILLEHTYRAICSTRRMVKAESVCIKAAAAFYVFSLSARLETETEAGVEREKGNSSKLRSGEGKSEKNPKSRFPQQLNLHKECFSSPFMERKTRARKGNQGEKQKLKLNSVSY